MDRDELVQMRRDETVGVNADLNDEPVAVIHERPIVHGEGVDVAQSHQRLGVGIGDALQKIWPRDKPKARGFPSLTMTTYRNLA